MANIREISQNIFWVGGNDRRLERFENLFPLPNGISYNSWVIRDEKTVLIDTVDASIGALFMDNVAHALDGRSLDYLVLNHMEPDHCAAIMEILRRYPNVQVVGNPKTFRMLDQFYGRELEASPANNQLTVSEGDELPLGHHRLRFVMAPMVHWPEVMFTHELTEGILFSADAFGSFGALPGCLFADEVDFNHLFLDEFRRYYANIIGRYGAQVQMVLRKFSDTDLRMICPLHGPMWRADLDTLLARYDTWSRFLPEQTGVVLAYGSMYGNTERAVETLAATLSSLGVRDMRIHDISKSHPSHIIADIWKYSHLILAAPTYNMGLYYPMKALLEELTALGIRNRTVGLIGNHSWTSAALKEMTAMVKELKDVELLSPSPDLLSVQDSMTEGSLQQLAEAIVSSIHRVADDR